MNELDRKLIDTFDGKVLRKDLLHRIKKGTNVPTFVLEFLLARFCASDDQAEMDSGMEAVISSLQENYVKPDEANAAQSKVATKGKGFSGRAIISSVAGELLDSLIFMPIVFWGADVKSLAMMLAAQVTFKVCYEIVILPVTIQVVKALKRIEGMLNIRIWHKYKL